MRASLIFIFTVTSALNDTKHNTRFRHPKLIISFWMTISASKQRPSLKIQPPKPAHVHQKKKKHTKNTKNQKLPRKENIFQVISSLKGVHSGMWERHNWANPPVPWVSETHSAMSNSLQPYGLYNPWNSLGQNTGVGGLSLLQGIFPTQESNPGLPHCRWILYHLSHMVYGI